MKYIPLLVFIVFFSNCKKDNESQTILELSNIESKKLKQEKLTGIDQLTPSSFCVFDSILMVSDYTQNPRLHFYKKKSMEKITSYGYIGKGPEEYNSPECNCQVFSRNGTKDKYIMIYEFGYGLIHEVNLSAILRKEKNVKTNKYYLNPEIYNADNLFFIDEQAFGEATDSKSVKYFKTDLNNTTQFEQLGSLNDDDFLKQLSVEDRVNFDRSFMKYSEDNKKFVAAYLRYNKIKILDSLLNEVHTIQIGKTEKGPETRDLSSLDNVFYFRMPYAGKRLFYVPYVGVKNSETTRPEGIFVFDYKGNFIIKYELETPILSFTVDEDENKIYVITGLDDNPFVTYDIN